MYELLYSCGKNRNAIKNFCYLNLTSFSIYGWDKFAPISNFTAPLSPASPLLPPHPFPLPHTLPPHPHPFPHPLHPHLPMSLINFLPEQEDSGTNRLVFGKQRKIYSALLKTLFCYLLTQLHFSKTVSIATHLNTHHAFRLYEIFLYFISLLLFSFLHRAPFPVQHAVHGFQNLKQCFHFSVASWLQLFCSSYRLLSHGFSHFHLFIICCLTKICACLNFKSRVRQFLGCLLPWS